MTPRGRAALKAHAQRLDVPLSLAVSPSRLPAPVRVHWAAIAQLKAEGLGPAAIGRAIDLDHSSVIHALKRMAA